MNSGRWQFAIDVGGTFTDVVARRPDGSLTTHKVLSSGRTKGVLAPGSTDRTVRDPARRGDPPAFWVGYTLELSGTGEKKPARASVCRFDAGSGRFHLDPPLPRRPVAGERHELFSHEPSPLLAMRYLMGLGLDEAIGAVDMRLGSTRSTNALLERKGARTVLVTTAGFADILSIANQDRPQLFELDIRKPRQLAGEVIELHERIDARGAVLVKLDPDEVRRKLRSPDAPQRCSLAVCLLNSYANPAHEEMVAGVADEMGFAHVSVSSRVNPLQRIVSRCDTTVVDAYLAPVIRDYVRCVRAAAPHAPLLLMTSAGGLVDSANFAAKDTLLSGPAGGVVGFAHVGSRAGLDRTIGFDMGGTSTDVSRFDGGYEYQFECTKGGVRVVAPMLAVETVAAGGGSICAFDGQKLVVGPRSAGADPGPACYGSGGPLTLTDVNLFLGRILPGHFPFPLDRAGVEAHLAQMADRIKKATKHAFSPVELAEGFIRIANENMAAAIRRISVARGYDPGDYTLITFGGAGAQHACAVAELLGVRRVLLSPMAGVLSAFGISVADVKRFAEHMVLERYTAKSLAALESVFENMEERLLREILGDGVAEHNILPATRMLDLRYVGEDSVITVSAEDGRYAAPFERLHEQLYGYKHDGRAIEIVAARAERVGVTPKPPPETAPIADAPPRPQEVATVFFEGAEHSSPVHHRASLRAGQRWGGPAMIIERTSTIVLEPAWSAQVLENGDILLTSPDGQAPRAQESTEADPVRLELFNNRFAAIAEQMGTTLRRTALSTNVKERLDFSCAIFTAEGELVANAPHLPVHLGSMSDCVKAVLSEAGDLQPGDVILNNDPFAGGTHVPDLTCVTPVFDDEERSILFFVANRAHHAELGGTQPGSMPADSTTLAEEGVLIRHFRIVERAQMRVDALRKLLKEAPFPSRACEENIADVTAQIAANQTGIAELRAMLETHGRRVVQAYTGHIRRAAEEKMRASLARLGAGRHTFRDSLDDGSAIAVAITIAGERATIDFTGSSGVHPGNFNANRAVVTSAVLYCFRCLIDEDIPLNAGVLTPLEIIVPPGMLDPPRHEDPARCAAVAAGNVETSQRLVDVIFGALRTVAASQGTMNNLIFGDGSFGYYETICGGAGAGPGFDGADAVHTHMTNTRQTDPEVLESRYPVRLERLQIRRGSGGAGRHRGGDGVIRELHFLKSLRVSIISQRRSKQPYGLAGGAPGAYGRNLLTRAEAKNREALPGIVSFEVDPGDVLTIETPGGGGYGPPA